MLVSSPALKLRSSRTWLTLSVPTPSPPSPAPAPRCRLSSSKASDSTATSSPMAPLPSTSSTPPLALLELTVPLLSPSRTTYLLLSTLTKSSFRSSFLVIYCFDTVSIYTFGMLYTHLIHITSHNIKYSYRAGLVHPQILMYFSVFPKSKKLLRLLGVVVVLSLFSWDFIGAE